MTKDDPDWEARIINLAYAIKRALRRTMAKPKIKIFIAETNQLYDEQMKIISEFESNEVSFFGVKPNIKDPEAWKEQLRQSYLSSQFSLHFFGPAYFERIPGKSIEQFQWEQAIEFIKNDPVKAVTFKAISWIPDALSGIEPAQQNIIDKVRQENRVPNTCIDHQNKSLEQFKNSLKELIDKLKAN